MDARQGRWLRVELRCALVCACLAARKRRVTGGGSPLLNSPPPAFPSYAHVDNCRRCICALSNNHRTSSGLIRPWYVVNARFRTSAYASTRASASITSSDRAPFGVAALADVGGFGVSTASADRGAARVARAITRIIGSDSGWACWPAIEVSQFRSPHIPEASYRSGRLHRHRPPSTSWPIDGHFGNWREACLIHFGRKRSSGMLPDSTKSVDSRSAFIYR
jgi:hypothetical protein